MSLLSGLTAVPCNSNALGPARSQPRSFCSRVLPLLAALATLGSGCGDIAPPRDLSTQVSEQVLFAPRNVALGKPATQSSTFQNSSGFAASNAVDGYLFSQMWPAWRLAHTNSEYQPWWKVDLLDNLFINQVVIYNRNDCCAERLTDFNVMVSEDEKTWRTISFSGTQPSPLTVNVDQVARYVKIQLRGTGILNINEVQVVQTMPGRNLAKGMPTSQSSTPAGGEPAHAVDGNTDGNYRNGSVTHTDLQYQPWWWVGLQSVQRVSWVVIHNRTDCCAERLTDFTVFLLRADGTWRQIVYSTPQAFPLVVPVDDDISQVSIQLNGTGILSLAEVQVLGGEAPNLARNKPVWNGFGNLYTASPTFVSGDRGVDGNTDGDYRNGTVTESASADHPFKIIDLQDNRFVSSVAVYNRSDCCGGRLSQYSIVLSSDLIEWRMFSSPGVPASDVGSYIRVNSFARYVGVRLDSVNYLDTSEIRVLGAPVQCPAGQTLLEDKYCVTLTPWVSGTTPADGTLIAMRQANNYSGGTVGPWNKFLTKQGLQIDANQVELRCASLFNITTWTGDISAPGIGTAQDYGFPWFILGTAAGTYVKSATSEGAPTNGKIWGDADLSHATLFTRGAGGVAPGLQELGRYAYQSWSPLWADRQVVLDFAKPRSKPVATRGHTPSSNLLYTYWDTGSTYSSNVDFFIVSGAPAVCN